MNHSEYNPYLNNSNNKRKLTLDFHILDHLIDNFHESNSFSKASSSNSIKNLSSNSSLDKNQSDCSTNDGLEFSRPVSRKPIKLRGTKEPLESSLELNQNNFDTHNCRKRIKTNFLSQEYKEISIIESQTICDKDNSQDTRDLEMIFIRENLVEDSSLMKDNQQLRNNYDNSNMTTTTSQDENASIEIFSNYPRRDNSQEKQKSHSKIDHHAINYNETSSEGMVSMKQKIPGVRFDPAGHRWVASWSIGGKQIQKYFPTKKYGNSKAREMAIDARKQAMDKEVVNCIDSTNKMRTGKIGNYNLSEILDIPEQEKPPIPVEKSSSEETCLKVLMNNESSKEEFNCSEILDKTLFVFVPGHSLLVSLPATIQRVPVSEINQVGLESYKHIDIISLPNMTYEYSPSMSHIDSETVKLATDMAQRVSELLKSSQATSD